MTSIAASSLDLRLIDNNLSTFSRITSLMSSLKLNAINIIIPLKVSSSRRFFIESSSLPSLKRLFSDLKSSNVSCIASFTPASSNDFSHFQESDPSSHTQYFECIKSFLSSVTPSSFFAVNPLSSLPSSMSFNSDVYKQIVSLCCEAFPLISVLVDDSFVSNSSLFNHFKKTKCFDQLLWSHSFKVRACSCTKRSSFYNLKYLSQILKRSSKLNIPVIVSMNLPNHKKETVAFKMMGQLIWMLSRLGVGFVASQLTSQDFTSLTLPDLTPKPLSLSTLPPIFSTPSYKQSLLFINSKLQIESRRGARGLSSVLVPLLKHNKLVVNVSMIQTKSFFDNSRVFFVESKQEESLDQLSTAMSTMSKPECQFSFLRPVCNYGHFHDGSYGVYAIFDTTKLSVKVVYSELIAKMVRNYSLCSFSMLQASSNEYGGLIVGFETEKGAKKGYECVRSLLLSRDNLLAVGVSAAGLSKHQEPEEAVVIERPRDVTRFPRLRVFIFITVVVLIIAFLLKILRVPMKE
ncbi:hypothetical protein RCL1_000191 [Eukaryota sp. TZLM3-RCL]